MYNYLVKFHDGRVGTGDDVWECFQEFMPDEEYEEFRRQQGRMGYLWSAYQTRTMSAQSQINTKIKVRRHAPIVSKSLVYETSTINHNGTQIAQVFRSESLETINLLRRKYSH